MFQNIPTNNSFRQWEGYLYKQKRDYLASLIPQETAFDATTIVVIPCFNESDIITVLQSLVDARHLNQRIIVVVVINSVERCDQEAVEQNRITMNEIIRFSAIKNSSEICFYPFLFENLPRKFAGVGLARKIGMDLAVHYFLETKNRRGVILSLDADCKVSDNYFTAVARAYADSATLGGIVLNFSHRVDDCNPLVRNAVRQYEDYIRYFSNMLQYIGFPYYWHTIGSAFAVSADAYVKSGGMGRQQGGEDFYFLQKIFSANDILFLKDVYVYPLARISNRVPFGTGPAIQKIIGEYAGTLKTYSPVAFEFLKDFFILKDLFFKKTESEAECMIQSLHPALITFLAATNLMNAINDCNNNCSTLNSFQKRFYNHFNAFKIIKFLNYIHDGIIDPISVDFIDDKHKKML